VVRRRSAAGARGGGPRSRGGRAARLVTGQRRRAWAWPALVAALSIVPIAGVFTVSRIFYVRDLALFFRSRHVWLRHVVFSGQLPFWDPYMGAGQSAVADALNQLLMPVTLAIRLLPPDVVAFNLWVALPLPIAALGTFCFLRRSHGPAGSALGAIVFALGGPMVSTLNFPNLSWCVAFLPWILWTTDRVLDRPAWRRSIALAILVALQALSGEPVTFAASLAVTVAYVASRRPAAVGIIAGALVAGVLLAAVQLVPLVLAGVRAHRAALQTPDFWSLHPLMLYETVAPHLFGNYYDAFFVSLPWMRALNSGREPFYFSLYVGPLAVVIASAGLVARPRSSWFWALVGVAAVVAAAGGYTPLYPFARRIFPPLAYFRFPVKYAVIASFALAALVAEGWAAIERGAREYRSELVPLARVVVVAAVLALVAVVAALALPGAAWAAVHALALRAHLQDPAAGADWLLRTAPPLVARAAALFLIGAALLWLLCVRPSRLAAIVLFAAVAADLAITNREINLTTEASKVAAPSWYRALASSQRVYIGGYFRGFMNTRDVDATREWQVPAEQTAVEGRQELNAELPLAASGWRVREALSYDLPVLWPSAYESVVRLFERAPAAERRAFLRRAGVRWCVLPAPLPGAAVIADVPHWSMRVYDCDPGAARVIVAGRVEAGGPPEWQRAALFDPALPDDLVRLDAPSGTVTGASAASGTARLIKDDVNEVQVEADLRTGGFVVLRDSFDPDWTAGVDGRPAAMLRANGLFRAVFVPDGRHVVRFRYRPRELTAGLTITMITALMLTALAVRSRRSTSMAGPPARPAAVRERGFTLMELMIVMALIAIVMSIAFAQYRHAQAAGDDASALASVRTIAAAEWSFAQTCGHQHYAPSLPALGQPAPATGEAFLSPDLTTGEEVEKSGYRFQVKAQPLENAPAACNGAPVSAGYAATADPVKPGISGTRFYGVNAERVIYVDTKTFTEGFEESGAPQHGTEIR